MKIRLTLFSQKQFQSHKIKSPTKTNERRIIITIEVIGSAAQIEEMNELYQKINYYVYEIRMIELDEYLYGMNRKKIDIEKAYDIITNCESNAIMNFWKGHYADRRYPFFKPREGKYNRSRAIAFYRKAEELDIKGMAEEGDKYAQVCLGNMYYYGEFLEKMYCNGRGRAVKWYRKAAEQGHAAAQYKLGLMYHYGHGVDENYSTAVEWYRKAAEQGHAYAQCNLGKMYRYGYGVDQNKSTAMKWYRKAAEQGVAYAQRNLDRLT